MTVLPAAAAEATKMLDGLRKTGDAVTALVFGNSPRSREIATLADVRAAGHRERRVVQVPESAILTGDAGLVALHRAAVDGFDVVFLTLDFTISSRLRGTDALDGSLHELGFSSALAGDVG